MRKVFILNMLCLTLGLSSLYSQSSLPLISISQLQYAGSFRLPASEFGDSSLNYSEGPIAYNKVNHSIFIVGHSQEQAIAEFSVPDLVNSTTIADLNMADPPVQGFMSILNRMSGGNSQNLNRIGGMRVISGPNGLELLVNAYEYYDADVNVTQSMIAIRNANNLAGSVDGAFVVSGGAGHTAGWISEIPQNWQPTLEGTHITGMSSGVPIIGRLSVGPSAFSFDPLDVVGKANESIPDIIPTTKLLDFSLTNRLNDDLNNTSGTNDLWTNLSRVTYGFIPKGTSTYITIGSSGGHVGGVCYKCVQDNGNKCGGYCTNIADDNYTYYWLWDINDLIAVKNGTVNSYDVRPYDYGVFDVPFPTSKIGGGSYDPESGLLYITLQRADREQGTFDNPPIVAVYQINVDSGSPIADAGFDQQVNEMGNGSAPVTLDGSNSFDFGEGTIESYIWQENGSDIASGVNPTVEFAVGVHTVTLTVTDNEGELSSDNVVITVVADQPPVALAGPDRTIFNDSLFTLDGSASYDPNGERDPISYLWEQTAGPSVTLINSDVSNPSFTAPPDNTTLEFKLRVTAGGESSEDSIVITSVEAPPVPQNGLVHFWPFDEESGNTALNLVNPAFNGTLSDGNTAPTRTTAGIVGNALSFDGSSIDSDERVDIPAFNLEGDAFTMSFWMNLPPQATSGPEAEGRLISKSTSTATNDHIFMLSTFANRVLRFRLKTTSGNNTRTFFSSANSFEFNTWHHVVAIYNGANLIILVDGTVVSSNNITGDIVQSNALVALGNQPADTGLERPMTGVLDQVRIYNRALTTEEINALRNEPSNTGSLIANAGLDQTLIDSDGNGTELVTLDGSGSSDSDGTIDSYIWRVDGNIIASVINPTVTLDVGVHTVTLEITDDDGNTSNDIVIITINEGSSTGTIVNVSNDSELQAAISSLTSGTTIVLAPRIYNLSNTLYIHTDDVTIRGATGNRDDIVLVGNGMDNSNFGSVPHGIWTDANNLHIADLSIGDVWFHPIFLSGDADSPHMQNLRLFDAGQQFVKGSSGGGVGLGCDNGIVENCLIEYTNQPPSHEGNVGYFNGVDVHGGSNWIIRNNRFVNLHNPDGTDHPYPPAVLMWNGSSGTLVENNIFINCDRSIALGLSGDRVPFDHQGGIIRNNIVYMDAGLFSSSRVNGADGAILVWNSSDTKVLHNTILVNGNHPNAIQFRFDTGGSEARNNLVDATIRDRENDGTYSESGNTTNAPLSLFKNPSQYDLLLKADASVAQEPLLSDCPEDIQGELRQGLVDVGADELVIENNITVDSDLDGISDLHEISMGTDPNDRNSVSKPVIETVNGTNVFSFQRSLGVTGYSMLLELSTDLDFWREATQDDGSYLIVNNGDGTETVQFSYGGASPIFFRLKVESLPK